MKKSFFVDIFLVFSLSVFASEKVMNRTLGSVGEEVVTLRDVQMSYLVELALLGKNFNKKIQATKTEFFKRYVGKYILELMIYIDAKEFGLKTNESSAAKASQLKAQLKKWPLWKELGASQNEFQQLLKRRQVVNQFVSFKERVSELAVTDAEAKNYYEANKEKFSNRPYSNFEKSIKVYLKNSYAQKQIRDWYDALKEKYKVRLSL